MYALACLRARSLVYVPAWKRRREKERVLIPPSPGAGTPSWPNFTPPSFHPPVVVCCIPICLIFFLLYLSLSLSLFLLSPNSRLFSFFSLNTPCSFHPLVSPAASPFSFLRIFLLRPKSYFLSVFYVRRYNISEPYNFSRFDSTPLLSTKTARARARDSRCFQ